MCLTGDTIERQALAVHHQSRHHQKISASARSEQDPIRPDYSVDAPDHSLSICSEKVLEGAGSGALDLAVDGQVIRARRPFQRLITS